MAIPYSRYIIGGIPWYSVLMVSGILFAYLLGAREERRVGLPKDSMLDMVLIAVPFGILGARLYYVLMSLDQFAADPISVLYIWQGGIAMYGALLGGAAAVYIQCRIKRRSFLSLLDISAPGLALAQAIGRWGNYFNREAYGPVIQNASWQFFPAGVIIGDGMAQTWHVATFFYESMWNAAAFIVLWLTRKRMKQRGDAFLWYLALYGSGRFLVEQLRQDSLFAFGFRASQYLSLLLCFGVAAVFLYRQARKASGEALAASLLACAVPFARLLLPSDTLLSAIPLVLLLAAITCLLLAKPAPRFAMIWLVFDMTVSLFLLVFGLTWVWHSPYFIYAGLSIPLSLSIPYATLSGSKLPQPVSEV